MKQVNRFEACALLDAMINRRSRRFAPGMTLDGGYSDEAIAATIHYCKYVFEEYGRLPVNGGPFRTLLAYQAHRPDSDFYSRFYKDNVISESASQWPRMITSS
jgi:hypothetical protein